MMKLLVAAVALVGLVGAAKMNVLFWVVHLPCPSTSFVPSFP
jgi:hypothetical protein